MSKPILVLRWIAFLPGTILLAIVFALPMTLIARMIFSDGIGNIVLSIVTGHALPYAASKVAPTHKRAATLVTGVVAAAALLILVGAVLAIRLVGDGSLDREFWIFIVYVVLTLIGLAMGVRTGVDDADD